jgi:hypothetical protein
MYQASITLLQTDTEVPLFELNEPEEITIPEFPLAGEQCVFFTQDGSRILTSKILFVEYEDTNFGEVVILWTTNSIYQITDIEGDEYENDTELWVELDIDLDDDD